MTAHPTRSMPMDGSQSASRMPVLFVGHGSPMNAIADNEFSRAWSDIGSSLPTPRAVLCVSAHWETAGTRITVMQQPPTIHDFRGFPEALSAFVYPAPGSPALAQRVCELLTDREIRTDHHRGLDHGAWSVLCRLLPRADVPVVQLSLDRTREPAYHFALGSALKPLRDEGVLVVGSGNIVHNLHTLIWQDSAFDWAVEFDNAIRERILARDFESVIRYETLAPVAREAVPTREHFLPLLYVLGMTDPRDRIEFFCEQVTLGSISMCSVRVG